MTRARDIVVFERLLSEISATYINLSVNEVEKVLKNDFGRLSQTLGVDACILFSYSEHSNGTRMIKPFIWFVDELQETNRLLAKWLGKENPSLDAKTHQHAFSIHESGKPFVWTGIGKTPKEAEIEKQTLLSMGIKSTLAIPISYAGTVTGLLQLCTTRSHRTWSADFISQIRLFGEVFINALMRKTADEKLQKAFSEIKELKERFEADYLYLREEINVGQDFSGIVGKTEALKKILIKVKQVAPTNATVLILGETGTGKGLIARAIHNASIYGNRPLIQVNCAAVAPSLIESELFGHEKGAFTGATARRIGRFEAAKGTTLFLDEIGDLPLELQPKLLRVIEEGEFERVGGSTTIHTDVRLIAATNRDIEKEAEEGRFRRDLLYRLNIFPIFILPLRERLDDIPLFVLHFVDYYGKRAGKRLGAIPSTTIKALQEYAWPGNVRELKNVIERAVITSSDRNLQIEIPNDLKHLRKELKTLREIERESIIEILEKTHWRVKGPHGAAHYLDINPETLRSRMKKFDIQRPSPLLS